MKRNREHGRIISVETLNRGSALDADAAAGATSITVEDAGDFDEDGGWLYIGAQVVEFTACDDDTGVLTLADPLTDPAEQGDPVSVYDPMYEEVVDYQQALVELDGEYDNPDPVVAEVAEGVGDLPEGDRGRAGESCVLKRVSEDEWEVVGVGGRPRKSRGVRWEQDDAYALTAADVAAGSMTMPLTHRPCDEALTCVLASVPQQPTEWTIDYDAQALTIPLDGWEKAGDVAWVHYAYRKGIAAAPALGGGPQYIGATSAVGSITSIALPEGVEAGDTLILGSAAWASTSCADPRMTLDQTLPGQSTTLGHIWIGTADGSGDPIAVTVDAAATAAGTVLVAVRGAVVATQVLSDTAPVDTATPTAPQVTDARLTVAIALERTGSFSTGDISQTGGYTVVAYAPDDKVFADAAVWESGTAATSPADTYTFTGSIDGLAIVVYKIGAGA